MNLKCATIFLSVTMFACAARAAEKVRLEIKHQEGATYTSQAMTNTKQILTIAGMDIDTSSNSNVTIGIAVGKRGADGKLSIQQKTEAMLVVMSLPGGINITFDSNNPAAATSNIPELQAVLDTLRARVGASQTLVLDKDNKVLAVQGAEKVLENATPAAAEILKREINPEQLKQTAQQAYDIMPDKPVGVGDTWTRTTVSHIGGGQTLTFETRYEYLGTAAQDGRTLDKISATMLTVSYALDPESPSPLKVTKSELKIASSKGTLLFDRSRGIFVSNAATTRIVGSMTFSVMGMELPGKLDLTFDTSSTLVK